MATLVGSKLNRGVRAHVYESAAKFAAFYSEGKEGSIFYTGNDLQMNLLFEPRSSCAAFVSEINNSIRYFQLGEVMQFDKKFPSVRLEEYPDNVFTTDYNENDSDSEAYSIAVTRITHVSNMTKIDFETELQMVEDPNNDDFIGLDCYKCHLMGQAAFPAEKDNSNNWLWMSWHLHQRFDGLNTIGKHCVPQIAIKFVSCTGSVETFEGGLERVKVQVEIECPDDSIFASVKARIKPGLLSDSKAKTIATHVFVEDAGDFERCLTYKYEETHFFWTKHKQGMELGETEAHELRRSARIAILAERAK